MDNKYVTRVFDDETDYDSINADIQYLANVGYKVSDIVKKDGFIIFYFVEM